MLNFQVTNLEAVFLPSVKTTDKLCTPSLTLDNFSRRRKVLLTCIVMWTNIHLLTSYMMCFINARWILAYMYIYLYVWSQKPNRCPRLQLRHVVGLVWSGLVVTPHLYLICVDLIMQSTLSLPSDDKHDNLQVPNIIMTKEANYDSVHTYSTRNIQQYSLYKFCIFFSGIHGRFFLSRYGGTLLSSRNLSSFKLFTRTLRPQTWRLSYNKMELFFGGGGSSDSVGINRSDARNREWHRTEPGIPFLFRLQCFVWLTWGVDELNVGDSSKLFHVASDVG